MSDNKKRGKIGDKFFDESLEFVSIIESEKGLPAGEIINSGYDKNYFEFIEQED